MSKKTNEKIRCSFCGKTQDQVNKMIAGPDGLYICDECVDMCSMIVGEEKYYHPSHDDDDDEKEINLLKPVEIKEFLDEYVIGQDEAKKVLSVAVYNHYKRVMAPDDMDVELQKSNIIMVGPTGSGKTYLAQTLAKIINVPFAIADATTLTEAGYVGEDVENILLKLIQAADYDVERAQYGIVYIDEIIEGTNASVPPQGGRKHPQQELIPIDTTNILFICGGAFDGLEKIIEARLNQKSIGFNSILAKNSDKALGELLKEVAPQDFIKFGLIPEFIGRVPVSVSLEGLDVDAIIRIIKEPKNAMVKQYRKLFELDGVDLEFEEDAIREIAAEAYERKTGARGIRSIMEKVMMDVMFEIPSDETIEKCIITKNSVLGKEGPIVIRKGEKAEKKRA